MSWWRTLVSDLQWAGIVLVVYLVGVSAWIATQWFGWFIVEHSGFIRQAIQQFDDIMFRGLL